MSPGDQDAAIARLVKERFEAKKQHALLQSELSAAANSLRELSDVLRYLGTPVATPASQVIAVIERHSDLLAPSKIVSMMTEYSQLEKRIAELNDLAQKAGVD